MIQPAARRVADRAQRQRDVGPHLRVGVGHRRHQRLVGALGVDLRQRDHRLVANIGRALPERGRQGLERAGVGEPPEADDRRLPHLRVRVLQTVDQRGDAGRLAEVAQRQRHRAPDLEARIGERLDQRRGGRGPVLSLGDVAERVGGGDPGAHVGGAEVAQGRVEGDRGRARDQHRTSVRNRWGRDAQEISL